MKFSDLKVGDVFRCDYGGTRDSFIVLEHRAHGCVAGFREIPRVSDTFLDDAWSSRGLVSRWQKYRSVLVGRDEIVPRYWLSRWLLGWAIGYTKTVFVPHREPTAEELDQKAKEHEAELKAYGWDD